jgi:hypothetical protein
LKIRGTPTDNLSDVIQSLQLIRKSGLLTVERDGPGNSSELGRITFQDGQVVSADVGQLRGLDAFRKLLSWHTCHFIFEPALPTPKPSSLPANVRQNGPLVQQKYNNTSLNVYSPTPIVPYRFQAMQNILPDFQRFGLSRTHRQLFLLIDGKRSSQELARLIGRNPQEIQALLADLERTGLIGH